jgi:hypothetical protein
MSSKTPALAVAAVTDLRRQAVACQMDDLNALAEAVATALNEGDEERAAGLRASMDRFARAMAWNRDAVLPAILDYASKHRDDELFAPTFVLQSIAPASPKTIDLLARLSPDARALLEWLRPIVSSQNAAETGSTAGSPGSTQ